MQEEYAFTGPYREQVRQDREEIHALVTSGQFDEAKVRALAQRSAEAKTEMIVAKSRAHSKIWALLNPGQRELAEKLHPLFEQQGPRHGH
jgi:Spy/CpxP family protein refolding chaperone